MCITTSSSTTNATANQATTPAAADTPLVPDMALAMDMVTPTVAGERLRLDSAALLDVVNRGLLPAYDLGGVIRFRAVDVAAVAKEFATA